MLKGMPRLLLLALFSLIGMANAAYNPVGLFLVCSNGEAPVISALPTTVKKTTSSELDANGIPLLKVGGKMQYFPSHIASIGLQDWNRYLTTKDDGYLGEALLLADWLVGWQNKDTGVFENKFDYTPFAKMTIKAGWANAQAQGQAMSLLTRLGIVVGGEQGNRYLDAATLAMKPFYLDSSQGGVRTQLKKRVWYETFPTTPPSYLFSSFLYSLFGLYDLAETTGNKQAKTLYGIGSQSLRRNMALFDDPLSSRAYASLVHLGNPALAPVYMTPGTKGQVGAAARMLRQMECLTKDNFFEGWARRWERYAKKDDLNSEQK